MRLTGRSTAVILVAAVLVLAVISLRQAGIFGNGAAQTEKGALDHRSGANQPRAAEEPVAVNSGHNTGEAGPALLYALSYQETAASIRTRGYNIFTADQAQKLIMVRRRFKNEIYAAHATDGTRQLVFSDEGPSFEILPEGEQAFALGGGKAFVLGIEREWRTGPSPGAFSKPPAIYELSLDGSNRWRKLFELGAENPSGKLFATVDGSKLGYLTLEYGKETVSIISLPEGKLLRSWNARQWSLARCPDANFSRTGWLADGKTIFMTLQAPAGDEPPGPGCDQTYLLSEEGNELGRESLENAEIESGKGPQPGVGLFIGQGMDGRNLFMSYREPRGQAAAGGWLMFAADPQKQSVQQVALEARPVGIFFWLSPSGRYLAFLEERYLKESGQSEKHIWVKDRVTGKESDAASLLPVRYGSAQPLVSIHVLGVADEKR